MAAPYLVFTFTLTLTEIHTQNNKDAGKLLAAI